MSEENKNYKVSGFGEKFDFCAEVNLLTDKTGTAISIAGNGVCSTLSLKEGLSLESRVALEDFLNKKLQKDIESFFYQEIERAVAKKEKEIVEIVKGYDRFKCGACDDKVSNLSHTQFCIFRSDILSLLTKEK